MSKKRISLIAIIVLLVILIIIGIWFFFFKKNNQGATTGNTSTNYFPFGQGGGGNSSTQNSSGGDTAGNTSSSTNTGGNTTKGGARGNTRGGAGDTSGITIGDGIGDNASSTIDIGGGTTASIPRLRQLSTAPVAGATSNSAYSAEYIERATGNIYSVSMTSLRAPQRLSNTTIPKLYEAMWAGSGDSVLIRYLQGDTASIVSFYGSLKATSAASANTVEIGQDTGSGSGLGGVQGSFLAADIGNMSVSPTKDKLFYLTEDQSGQEIGVIYNTSDAKKTQVFQSPFRDWLSQWPKANVIALTTKPSANVAGYLYFLNDFLDTKKSAFTRILGDINGLTTLTSPDTKNVLYSQSNNGGFTLNTYNIKDNKSQPISLTTLPEKCVWSKINVNVVYCAIPANIPNTDYPDAWYQGLVSFSDNIWGINTATGETDLLINIPDFSGKEIDAIKPFLSDSEQFLFFTNKKDSMLWSLDLTQTKQVGVGTGTGVGAGENIGAGTNDTGSSIEIGS